MYVSYFFSLSHYFFFFTSSQWKYKYLANYPLLDNDLLKIYFKSMSPQQAHAFQEKSTSSTTLKHIRSHFQ